MERIRVRRIQQKAKHSAEVLRYSPPVTHHKIRGALSVWLLLKVVESANISPVFILLDAARTSG